MSPAEKKAVQKLFVVTALYYDQELPDQVVKLYVEDVADLPFEEVERGINELRRSPKTLKCPTPAQVRAHVRPQASETDRAMLAASEVIEAISKVGYYGKPELSPIAQEIVRREGGWQNVCSLISKNEQISFYRAQWRDLARALIAGYVQNGHSLPALENQGMKLLASSVGGKVEDGEG